MPRISAALLAQAIAILAAPAVFAQAPVAIPADIPETDPGAIYVEAEDAISTNFSRAPEIRYGASGNQTLRLYRKTAPYGGVAWYAEYAILVDEAGEYELWYAGTPPASAAPDLPGYFGPVDVSLDGGAPVRLFRERSTVLAAGDYSRRWVSIGRRTLSPGAHTIRFEIREKRPADGVFAFELDAMAALRVPAGAPAPAPRGSFPDPESARAPLAASEYERRIKADPRDAEAHRALIETAFALGDSSSAVRYAFRASALLPDDPFYVKALARARIGIDDLPSGLAAWDRYLSLKPDDLAGWQEAAKTAAWRSEYAKAIALYRAGLAAFPGDPTLSVDYGLALIWSGQATQGELWLKNAGKAALADPDRALALAAAYSASGYRDYAESLLAQAARAFPARADLRYALARALERLGDRGGADRILAEARAAYSPDPRFDAFATREEQTVRLARDTLATLGERSRAAPDDLYARELYVQALFWNGRRQEAIQAYAALIVGKAYEALVKADDLAPALGASMDRLAALRLWASGLPASLARRQKALADASAAVDQAARTLQLFEEKAAKDRAAGKPETAPAGVHPQDALDAAKARLALVLLDESAASADDGARAAALESLVLELDALARDDLAPAADFAAGTAATGWYLDRALWVRDVREASGSGDVLGWFVATRLPSNQLTATEKAKAWSSMAASGVPAIAYAALREALLARNLPAAESLAAGPAAAYRPATVSLVAGLRAAPSMPAGAATFEDAAAAQASLASLSARAPALLASANRALERGIAIQGARDLRTLYAVEQETVALRRELGSFYLADGQTERAAEQFRNAVRNDPSDTAAIFELANLRQRSGDWMEAMQLYRVVYGYDPSYANVQAFHNALARSHADRLRLSAMGFTDSTLASADAAASWSMGLSSTLALGAGVSVRQVRRYVESSFEVDDGAGGTVTVTENPGAQSMGDVSAILSYAPLAGGFGLEAELGATVFDRRSSPGFTADTASLLSAFTGRDFYPKGALRATLGSAGLSAQLNLGARVMEESFIPGRPDMYRGSAEASLTLPFMDFSYSRTYGRLDGVVVNLDLADARAIATALQEVAIGIHLADAPWTNLMLSAEASFEHAFRREPWLYYAPDLVVNARAAAAWMTWLGLGGGDVLGLSARAAGGLYADSRETYPIVQLEGRIEWTRRAAVITLRGFATQTFPRSGSGYWAGGIELSGSVPAPDLIAP